ncbi:type II toxin-antitoxin system RelE/ParE family toxin [Urbifossiella limnaea]|uniref:Plasmid stabilization system protein n=1 Tax=Urbifossiella limnaea TaxID=2528023 RepID=A0A517Y2X5_9BACT|nr:type II toxin-antitoxin system RelE/ParE family toxin [Urbifossiella limnaea]QDU24058.1 Plasmid stabilization system protein [Urbifossiella limnaea]
MANLEFLPGARRELREAFDWYRQRNPAAARRFVTEVDRVTAAIAAQPDRYGWYDPPFREAILNRYPFSVIYRVDDAGDVLVVAVAHASREPGYWLDRT